MPPKTKKKKSNTPPPCFCCRKVSRERYDAHVAKKILPLISSDEWQLSWDHRELLPTTGSQDLENFSVLKQVFLFLHFDTHTLLAVAATCKSWRVMADRLPHWRYLLPLRSEVAKLVDTLPWARFHGCRRRDGGRRGGGDDHLDDDDGDDAIWYRRVYWKDAATGKEHYNHEVVEGAEDVLLFHQNALLEFVNCNRQRNKCFPCCFDQLCSWCCAECGWTSTGVQFSDFYLKGDFQEDDELERRRVAQWRLQTEGGAAIANMLRLSKEEQQIADENIQRERKPVNWFDMLKKKKKNNQNQQQQQQHGSGDDVQPFSSSSSSPRGDDDDDDDENYYDDGDDEDRLVQVTTTTSEPTTSSSRKNNNMMASIPLRKHRHAQRITPRRYRKEINAASVVPRVWQGAAVAAAAEDGEEDDQGDSIDDGSDKELNGNNNKRNYGNDDDDDDDDDDDISSPSDEDQEYYAQPSSRHHDDDDDDDDDRELGSKKKRRLPMRMTRFDSLDPREPIPTKATPVWCSNDPQIQKQRGSGDYNKRPALWDKIGNRIPIRMQRMTLLNNKFHITASTEFRKQWMFMRLSDYLTAVKEAIELHNKLFQVTSWQRYGENKNTVIWAVFFIVALCFMFAGLTGFFVDRTIFTQNDYALGRDVALCIAAVWGVTGGSFLMNKITSASGSLCFQNASRSKLLSLLTVGQVLLTLAVPLALTTFRVNVTDRLLAGGTISVCDAWANLSSSLLPATSSPRFPNSLQCELTKQFLPTRLAESTFLEFPPGTRILWHPPSSGSSLLSRTVPFVARRSALHSDTCTVSSDGVVEPLDLGYNNSRSIIDRNPFSYYTIFLPPKNSTTSNCSRSEIRNATVLIIGDFSLCPFWSISQHNATSNNKSSDGKKNPLLLLLHSRFDGVLQSNTASEAISAASTISDQLANALTQRQGTTTASSIFPECGTAENAMINVVDQAAATRKSTRKPTKRHHINFHLRVATGWSPHYTASYFIARDDAAATWRKDALDFKLNGVVALTADSHIFLAHENSASPTVPDLVSPFNAGELTAVVDGDGAEEDGKLMSNLWTAAHPYGLRKLRHDFLVASRGIIIFVSVVLAVSVFFAYFGRGTSRGLYIILSTSALLVIFGVPIPLVAITSICYDKAALGDADELIQPVMCLAAQRDDMAGPFALALFLLAVMVLLLALLGFLVCALSRGEDDDDYY